MNRQQSYASTNKGILYLVPTPIGNLEDITFRALRILKEVDVIAAEDTRQTRKLLTHFDITKPLTSYHEHNKKQSGDKLLVQLERGEQVALVSDAGMPAISDPGSDLVKEAIGRGITVIPLPGANAALTALISSGLNTAQFYFYGFLPRKKKEKLSVLESIKSIHGTLIFYESPHRVKDTVATLKETFGAEQKVVLARELSKRYEEFLRGTLEEMYELVNSEDFKGEFCILVEGSQSEEVTQSWWETLTVEQHVEHFISVQGLSSKEAIKQTAKERGLPKREVYQTYHVHNEK
ncbi:16S rRNA (cytidine(1402)-2'-O)-methyltransferase [Bacillus tianshenii]|nr:16S rRNA (cytidine(1402)-2'-O)-methyltransferase [Bacillus tianshenii]